ncbi:Ca(2+)-dependent cysteine protease [Rhodotorula kratochvilovae]
MAYPGQKYHLGYKHTVIPEGQGQGYGAPPGPPPQQYGQPQQQGYGGYGAPPGPPPYPQQQHQHHGGGGYGPPSGPPPGQYGGGGYNGGGGGGYDSGRGSGGYNPGYTSQEQGQGGYMHPHANQQQYNAPPSFAGQSPYPQQYGAAPGPPPTHYGSQEHRYNGPPQYQGGQFEMHMAPPTNMSSYYSQLTGKRKALCIGINYTGTSSQLNGCHNDARNLSKFLCERFGYKEDDIVMLMDTPGASGMSVPTRDNILRAMQWLVRDAQPNDSLFFHFSGHGGQTAATEGDEIDGYDETIYPLDHKTAGVIVDNDMHRIMVSPLPQGCRLTAIFDCCHSGSALDLPYTYSTEGKLKEPSMLADAGSGALGAATSYLRGDMGGVFKTLTGVGKRIMNGDKATEYTKATRSSNADVISLSGCRDKETSADTSVGGQATGAMSWSLIASLTKYPQQTWLQLLNTIRDEIKAYTQKPQLACSHEMDLNLIAAF